MVRWLPGTALLLPFLSVLAQSAFAQDTARVEEPEWLLATLEDSVPAADGQVLRFRHVRGDVRVKAVETDRIQVTAIAQYRSDDPRTPAIRFLPPTPGTGASRHQLTVDFALLEVPENDAWAKRRIDVGLLVPRGVAFEIETGDGLIEAGDVTSRAKLTSVRGAISYKGSGDLEARSDRGALRVLFEKTGSPRSVAISSLTGDIACLFLEGADARIELTTRGPITTDYSLAIERKAGSPLKHGRVQIGEGGSSIHLESHSGGIRLQGLIVPEDSQ